MQSFACAIFSIPIFAVFFSSVIADEKSSTPSQPWDEWAAKYPAWVTPIQPFNVIGNVYYVGTEGLASYLIVSKSGHVLLDGGMPQNAEIIADNVRQLGFKPADIKVLLNSHAHFDHSGGLAKLKELTGATLIASEGDKEALETGLYPGSAELAYSAPPVTVDQVVADGEEVKLSTITLKANITPGHTPGCTSWSMSVSYENKTYQTLFFCSATVAGNRLVGPPQYEGIVGDYRKTFDLTKDWKPDVFLSNHPGLFDMKSKLVKRRAGDALAFVESELFPTMMVKLEQAFEKALEKQLNAMESSDNAADQH